MKLVPIYLVASFLHLLIFSLLYLFIPVLRLSLVEEDKFLENLTVIYYFDSFLLGIFFFLSSINKRKKAYIALPIIGLLCFLDEISFGERIFGLKMPIIYGKKIDALHDVIDLMKRFILYNLIPKFNGMSGYAKGLVGLFVLISIVFCLINMRKRKHLISRALEIPKSHPAFLFLPFFVGSLIISQAVDLHLIKGLDPDFLVYLEEWSEMNAAFSLLFASLAIRWEWHKPVQPLLFENSSIRLPVK